MSYVDVVKATPALDLLYLFDELAGAAAVIDASGNAHNGTPVNLAFGAAPIALDGGHAATFAGAGASRVDAGDVESYPGRQTFALEFFIRPAVVAGHVVNRWRYGGDGYALRFNASGRLVFERTAGLQTFATPDTGPIIQAGQRVYVLARYDGLQLQLLVGTPTSAPVLAGAVASADLIDETVVPVNLLSNPSAETNVTGWAVGSGTLVRVADGRVGGFSGETTRNATGNSINPIPGGLTAIPVAPGDQVYIVGSSKHVAALPTTPNKLHMRWFDAAGVQVGGQVETGAGVVTVADTWTDGAALLIAPAGAVLCRPGFAYTNSVAANFTIRADRWMVVRNPLRFAPAQLDNFAVDSSASYISSFDGVSAVGTGTIAGGVLSPISGSVRSWVRPDWGALGDMRATFRFRTGAVLPGTGQVMLTLKADAANTYMRFGWRSGSLRLDSLVAGVATGIVTIAAPLAINTDYTLRATVYGDMFVITLWLGAAGSGTILATLPWVLSGADKVRFGAGTTGFFGLNWSGFANDLQMDDLQVETITNALPDYFDGSLPGFQWDGAAHASTSRPIAGALRFGASGGPNPAQLYQGDMDDAAIYRAAIDDARARHHWAVGMGLERGPSWQPDRRFVSNGSAPAGADGNIGYGMFGSTINLADALADDVVTRDPMLMDRLRATKFFAEVAA